MSESPVARSSKPTFKLPNPKWIIALAIPVIILGAGIHQFNRPYPALQAKPSSESIVLPGNFSVNFPDQGESAVGTDNIGVVAASANQNAVPIASLAKMMTAYLVLKAHPLQTGQVGPSLTINDQDMADYQNQLKNGGSVLPVSLGESLTEKELLQGLMLPSGNNVANTLGRWVAGSDDAFVAEMNKAAKSLGMTSTHYADASGVNPATVSNASDQVKIAQAAMADPIFQEIVAMPQATLPVAGTVYNVNSMLGKHEIVGVKTGSSTPAGGCFVSATPVTDGNQKHFIIAAVLGQKTFRSLQSALDANVAILDQVRSQFKSYPLTQPATGFGQIQSAWHSSSELKAAQPLKIFGYPGMKVSLSIEPVKAQLPISSGANVATLKVQAGQEVQNVPLTNTQPIKAPSFFWRVIRY